MKKEIPFTIEYKLKNGGALANKIVYATTKKQARERLEIELITNGIYMSQITVKSIQPLI